MLKKQQKKDLVKKLVEELKQVKGLVLSAFQGLPTKEIQELRAILRKEKVAHKVVKLTLLKRALRLAGVDVSKFAFEVPLAVSMSTEDEVMPAKLLHTFAKKHENLKLVAGVLEKKLVTDLQVKQLALLPGKQELRGQVVGAIAGPLRGLVSVLSGNLKGFVNVLNAIKDSKS